MMTDHLPVEGDLLGFDDEQVSSLKTAAPALVGVGTVHRLRVLGKLPSEHIGKDIDSIGKTGLEKRQYRVAFGM